jgi:hypothetical protein
MKMAFGHQPIATLFPCQSPDRQNFPGGENQVKVWIPEVFQQLFGSGKSA